jgi:hypothetical protein
MNILILLYHHLKVFGGKKVSMVLIIDVKMIFVSLLRLSGFVSRENFDWVLQQATIKKKDFSKVEFLTYDEGFCVQCLHIGTYNEEPITIERMHTYMENEGYQQDITDERMHHETYISYFRKTEPARLKTVLRHPINKA